MDPGIRARQIQQVMLFLAAPFAIVLMFVIFYYLLGALYEERKDKSVLFWKSLPVSDLATVGAKVASALVVAPFVTLACIALTQVAVLIIISLLSISSDVSIWSAIWAPSNLIYHWTWLTTVFLLQALSMLPLFGWALYVSAFSQTRPLFWALGVPVAIVIVEQLLLDVSLIGDFIGRHATFVSFGMFGGPLELSDILDVIVSVDIWLGIGVGIAFMAATVWQRRTSD
jgi:ABC-2 type transport system permease protein